MSAATNPTTTIAALITAAHGAQRVEVVPRPDNWQLRERVETAMRALRWPEQDEDPETVMERGLAALELLCSRLAVAEANDALHKAQLRRAVDAFDEQSEEVERLRGMLR